MAHSFRRRCRTKVFLMFVVFSIICFQYIGCGGSSSDNEYVNDEGGEVSEAASNSAPAEKNISEQIIDSPSFAGYLFLYVDESANARIDDGNKNLFSKSMSVSVNNISKVLASLRYNRIERAVDIPEEVLDVRREKLSRSSGKKLADWNSIFKIYVDSKEDALALYKALQGVEGVANIYPAMKRSPLSVASAPDLSSLQGYLTQMSASSIWNAGSKGEGVTLVQNEDGVNPFHEDLDIVVGCVYEGGSFIDMYCDDPSLPAYAEASKYHGTAGAGILIARHDAHGVNGFVPGVNYRFTGSSYSALTGEAVEPGSIWMIAMGYDVGNDSLPVEVMQFDFDSIEDAVAHGVTVVVGAGNGTGTTAYNRTGINLDSYNYTGLVNLKTNDSGSIIIGASDGNNKNKVLFSNCGAMVDLFGWGQGVVTTSYPYAPYAPDDGWVGTKPAGLTNSTANTYYTNNYGGTSSATAIVAGSAALVQGYFKKEIGALKYLTPAKMKAILTDSGVSQASGCNIGKQPNLAAAKVAIDTFISSIRSQFPEIETGAALTATRAQELKNLGVGLLCYENNISKSDALCPDEEIFPSQTNAFAKTMDFDGDGRADLVQWSNGTLKIDLSASGFSGDNFGDWDVEVDLPVINGQWVVPVIEDVNKDNKADITIYDKENGLWYVRYTDADLLRRSATLNWQWDFFLDYSSQWQDTRGTDPLNLTNNLVQSKYSRPYIANAEPGADTSLDFVIACSDGKLRVDLSSNGYGSFDVEYEYLTPAQLAMAPGWAYLTEVFTPSTTDKTLKLLIKSPDGIKYSDESDAGGRLAYRTAVLNSPTTSFLTEYGPMVVGMHGGNDYLLLPGNYGPLQSKVYMGLKNLEGEWFVSTCADPLQCPFPLNGLLELAVPSQDFGGTGCHPIVADYDGDGFSDKAVMCPDGWRIMYSNDEAYSRDRDGGNGIRIVPLEYDPSVFTLPGKFYAGGASYQHVKSLIQTYQALNPNTPPPIPVDMLSVSSQ